jgi:hypothetical protein
MRSGLDGRKRIRSIIIAIILATLPCYCLGILALQFAELAHPTSTATPMNLVTLTVLSSQTLVNATLETPTASPTVTATSTVTITLTPFMPATFTTTPTQTITTTITPTLTPLPTVTATLMIPSLTPTITSTLPSSAP